MKTGTVSLARFLALGVSGCCCEGGSPEALNIAPNGRALAAVSQDARLSLALGAAPGSESGTIYGWGKREREQRRIAATHCRYHEADPKCGSDARPAGHAGHAG